MKKYIQKWKKLNKNGIKLSLICVINRLIIFISTSQFFVLSAIFLGMLTYYMPQDIQFFTLRVLELIVIVKIAIDTIYFPTFTVHLFGDYEGKFDFHHRLIQFRLSRKSAFTKQAEGHLSAKH